MTDEPQTDLEVRVTKLEMYVKQLRDQQRAKMIRHYNNSYRCLECGGRWHNAEKENHQRFCLATP